MLIINERQLALIHKYPRRVPVWLEAPASDPAGWLLLWSKYKLHKRVINCITIVCGEPWSPSPLWTQPQIGETQLKDKTTLQPSDNDLEAAPTTSCIGSNVYNINKLQRQL